MAEYMTTDELAALCRAPVPTVRYWRHVGKGPASIRVGKRVLYDTAEVERWLDSLREPAPAA